MKRTLSVLSGAIALSFLVTGCPKVPRQSPMMAHTGKIAVSSADLRVRVYDFAERFAAVVIQAADEIIREADDPQVRLAALRWKIEAVPAAQSAVFKFDPLAGLIDVWALTIQMRDYFETGDGRELFDHWQPVAVDASKLLEVEVEQLAASVAVDPDISVTETRVEDWARANPIEESIFVRRSIRPLLAEITGRTSGGAIASIGNLSEAVSDLSERLVIHAEIMPSQARWQAELLLAEHELPSKIDSVVRDAGAITDTLERATVVVEGLPDLVEVETARMLAALREEVDGLDDLIEAQRAAAFTDVAAERVAVLDAVSREREIVIDEIHQARVATVEDVERIANDIVDRSFDRAEKLIDVVVWRMTILVGIGFATLIVTVLVAARMMRP